MHTLLIAVHCNCGTENSTVYCKYSYNLIFRLINAVYAQFCFQTSDCKDFNQQAVRHVFLLYVNQISQSFQQHVMRNDAENKLSK